MFDNFDLPSLLHYTPPGNQLTASFLPVPSPGKGELGVRPATSPRKSCNRYRNVNESKFINSCSGTGRQPTETAYDTP